MAGENKIGSVYLEIGAVANDFNKAVADAKVKAGGLNTELNTTTTSAGKLGAVTSDSSRNMVKWAAVIGAVTIAVAAASRAFIGLVQRGMEAEEATSKFNTIFAENADQVRTWATELGVATGASSRGLQNMAADAMALVSPLAGSREAAISMSQGLVQMAQDLSSFNNVPVTDALTALRSGISGEAEPMKRFGILLTETALQEYALSTGINKRVSQMNTAELTQLRYNAMLAKMGAAQGDAERTSGSLTNVLRSIDGIMSDMATDAGTRLVPSMTDLSVAFRDALREGSGLKVAIDAIVTGLISLVNAAATVTRGLSESGQAEQAWRDQVSALDGKLSEIIETYGSYANAQAAATNGGQQAIEMTGGYSLQLNHLIDNLGATNNLLSQHRSQYQFVNAGATQLINSLTIQTAATGANTRATGTNTSAQRGNASAQKEREAAVQRTSDIIAKSTLSETALVAYEAAKQQRELEKMLTQRLITAEQYSQASEAIERDTQARITQIHREEQAKRNESVVAGIGTISSTAGNLVGQLGGLFAMDAQNRTSALDIQMTKELETIGARYESEKKQIEQSGDDATTKAAKLKALDEKRAREEKSLRDKTDKDKRKIEREAAKRQKQIAIAETLLAIPQMAIQSYKALAGIPVVGPALGAIAAAAATALGFAKLALIQQTPLPEAAYGMYGETPFIAGERGPEVAFSLDSERGKVGLRTFAQQLIGEVGRQQSTGATVVSGGASEIRNIIYLDSTIIYDKVSKATENGLITINVRSLVGA